MNLSIFINHFMILFLILSFCVGLVNLFALILLYYTKKNMIIKTITIIIALINWELLRSSSLQYLINISYNYDKIYSFDYYTGIFTFIFISFLIYTINTSTDLFFNTTSLKRKNTQLIIASIPIFLLILNRFSINSFNKISLYYVFPILFLSIILSIYKLIVNRKNFKIKITKSYKTITLLFFIFIFLIIYTNYLNGNIFLNAISVALPFFFINIISIILIVRYLYTDKDTIDDFLNIYSLTDREIEISKLILKGLNNKDISRKLFIAEGTVKNHIYSIFKKMNINSRIEFILLIYKK